MNDNERLYTKHFATVRDLLLVLPSADCIYTRRFHRSFFSFLTTIITITVTIIIVIIVFVVIIVWLEYCLQDWCAAADGLR